MCCASGEETVRNTSLDSQSPYVSVPFSLEILDLLPPSNAKSLLSSALSRRALEVQ